MVNPNIVGNGVKKQPSLLFDKAITRLNRDKRPACGSNIRRRALLWKPTTKGTHK